MKKYVAALFLFAAFAHSAYAADKGFYIGANVGSTSSDYSGSKSPTAFTLQGGYQFNKNFAVEAQYGDFGNIAPAGSLKPTGISVAAVGILPFNEQWSGYGKLGMASVDSKISGSGLAGGDGTYKKSAVTYGIGGQFNVNQALGIRFGVDRYSTGGSQGGWMLIDGKLTVFTVGIAYKF